MVYHEVQSEEGILQEWLKEHCEQFDADETNLIHTDIITLLGTLYPCTIAIY